MLQNLSSLSLKIGENLHQYFCNQNCSTTEAKEFLFQCLKYIGQIEDAAKAPIAEEVAKDFESVIEELEQPGVE